MFCFSTNLHGFKIIVLSQCPRGFFLVGATVDGQEMGICGGILSLLREID